MNEHAKKLHKDVIKGLELSSIVKVSVPAYAAALCVSLRSAQRYIQMLEKRNSALPDVEYTMVRRAHDKARYFLKPGAASLGQLLLADDWQMMPNDTNDTNDNLSYIYIYTKNKYKNKSLSLTTPRTTTTTPNGTNGVETSTIWYEETAGDFQELANSVCMVCRMNPMLLLPEDEAKIMQLFKAGVNPSRVEKRYGFMSKPNYWYNMHWKGIKNAWPTLVDLMQTWEQSGGYVYRKHHSWPPVKDIQDSMIAIMQKYGRKQQKIVMDKFAEFGYDEIVNRVPGGYYQMTMVNMVVLRIRIAEAVREIKKEGQRVKELAQV